MTEIFPYPDPRVIRFAFVMTWRFLEPKLPQPPPRVEREDDALAARRTARKQQSARRAA